MAEEPKTLAGIIRKAIHDFEFTPTTAMLQFGDDTPDLADFIARQIAARSEGPLPVGGEAHDLCGSVGSGLTPLVPSRVSDAGSATPSETPAWPLRWERRPWFAWRPVRVVDGGWAWLKRVERRELGWWPGGMFWACTERCYALLPRYRVQRVWRRTDQPRHGA